MFGCREVRLVTAGAKVRWVAVKDRVRAVVAADAVGVVEVLEIDGVKPLVASADGGEGGPAEVGLTRGAVAECGVRGATRAAESSLHNKEGAGRLLDVGQAGLRSAVGELNPAV